MYDNVICRYELLAASVGCFGAVCWMQPGKVSGLCSGCKPKSLYGGPVWSDDWLNSLRDRREDEERERGGGGARERKRDSVEVAGLQVDETV